jgi:hypothetical protein
MLITFFGVKCIVHFEFIPQAQIVDQTYYVEILKRLHEAVSRRRPELWPNYWILQHNNPPAHISFWPKNRLLKWNTHRIPIIWLRMTSSRFQK